MSIIHIIQYYLSLLNLFLDLRLWKWCYRWREERVTLTINIISFLLPSSGRIFRKHYNYHSPPFLYPSVLHTPPPFFLFHLFFHKTIFFFKFITSYPYPSWFIIYPYSPVASFFPNPTLFSLIYHMSCVLSFLVFPSL